MKESSNGNILGDALKSGIKSQQNPLFVLGYGGGGLELSSAKCWWLPIQRYLRKKFDFVTDFELILLKVSARNKSCASFMPA